MTSSRALPTLQHAWARGECMVGAAIKVPDALCAESVALAGFDCVYVDQQHGVFDDVQLLQVLQAIAAGGAVPLTRVPESQPWLIHKALDFGAAGIIVPLVETEADAARAAAACQYPPQGNRSYGLLRPSPAVAPYDLDRPACIVLVETAKGIDNLDAIAQAEGVDAIMAGPQDLALSMGIKLEGDWLRTPRLFEAILQIRKACGRYAIAAAIGAASGADALMWLEQGFQLVTVGNDLGYIYGSLRTQLVLARAAVGNGSPAAS
jgi:4-hydroxy-2-oxoheptanedioate aldolase